MIRNKALASTLVFAFVALACGSAERTAVRGTPGQSCVLPDPSSMVACDPPNACYRLMSKSPSAPDALVCTKPCTTAADCTFGGGEWVCEVSATPQGGGRETRVCTKR